MHTKILIPLTVARSTLMVGPRVDLTRLSGAECNPEAAYYASSRSSLEIRSRFWSGSGQFAECLECEMMVYAASCMFQSPVASQPLIRHTITGLDQASGFG